MPHHFLLALYLLLCLSLLSQDTIPYPWPHQGPDLDEAQIEALQAGIRLSRIFGQMHIDDTGKLRSIDGLELLLEAGTPIYAVREGSVLHIEQNLLVIGTPFERPDSIYWSFTQPFVYYDGLIPAADLQPGQLIHRGQQIGTVSLSATAPNHFFIGLGSNYFNQSTFPDGIPFNERNLLSFYCPLPYFVFPDSQAPRIAPSPIITSTTLIPLNAGDPLSQKVNFFIPLQDKGESYVSHDRGFLDFGFPPSLIEARVVPLNPDNTNIYNPIYTVRFFNTGCRDGMLTYFQYQGLSSIYHLELMLPVLQETMVDGDYPYWVGSLTAAAMEDGPYRLDVLVSDYRGNVSTTSFPFSIEKGEAIVEKKGKDKR